MIALIDGDILLYRVGYTTENEEDWVAMERMESLMQGILSATKATEHCVYFSAGREETFRAELYEDYKQNRTQPKPKHYGILKQFLVNEYNTSQEVGQEADDGMGIAQCENDLNAEGNMWHIDTVICSIDKDMLQIPGHHYNFVKDQFTFVTPEEGRLFFYKQLLIGDTVDNVKGCQGIGQAKASKLLDPTLESEELTQFSIVQDAYRAWLTKEWGEWDDFKEHQMNNIILLTGRLLKIRTRKDEVWELPIPFEH